MRLPQNGCDVSQPTRLSLWSDWPQHSELMAGVGRVGDDLQYSITVVKADDWKQTDGPVLFAEFNHSFAAICNATASKTSNQMH